jgi:hypothetical protein
MEARTSGLLGARRRWGPPRHMATGDLPAPERDAIVGLVARVRAERTRQGLPPSVSDAATIAAIAAVLSRRKAAPVPETSGAASQEVRRERTQPTR